MYQKPAIGIGIAAIVAVLCLAALASDSTRIEKSAAVDAEQYADFIENEVFDIQDLAEGAEIQRRMFNRMTPPGFSWVQPMFPPVVPFDADNFDEKFLDELLGEDKNSVAIYPLSLTQDPKTRETLVFNAEGKLIATIPADRVSREWPEEADPARVTLQLDLLPSEDVEPYLYTESRVAEYEEAQTAKTKESGGMALRSLGATEFGIAGVQRLTNGNMQITVTNGTDAAEVFAYTVWHTSSVSVVVWTNEFDEVLTNSHTAWHPVSPAFDGIESAWECLSTNLVLINGVGVYEDTDIPDNARVRFYAVVKLMDSDGDGLSDGAEILLYRTDPDNPDSDGDGLSDYEEVITYGTNPNDPDSDGDGLPDAWEVQHGLDPLDDGSENINNGPEGDPDGDGFSNSLELELSSPPDNPAWNGQQLAYRLTHARINTRSLTNDLIGLRVDIEDSSDCGGSAGTQNVPDSLYVPELLDCGYFIDITVEGMVEDVDVNYDKVSIEAFTNTFYFSGSSNRPSECRMISKTRTCNVLILGNSTVTLRYNTVSYKWHSGAYAEIVGAEETGALSVGMTAYRPQTETAGYGSPFQKTAVPDEAKESPGVGIRVNGDDDNNNGVPDHNDTTVNNENDLIEVELHGKPPSTPGGFIYTLKRSSSNIKVWDSSTKGTALLDANHETNLSFSTTPITVWVENPSGGNSSLELVVRTDAAGVICSDIINTYSFQTVVVGLSGEVWFGGDPLDNGMFNIAEHLYNNGYDVHYYDEDVVANNGAGAAYDEVVSAVKDRAVSYVGIYGHSHGGGSTHDLAERLHANRGIIGTFTINFTAYIDAIENDSDFDTDSEIRLPPSTTYHMNYYQTNDSLLVGGPVIGANENLNVNTTQWGQNLNHGSIDNDPTVINAVGARAIQKMQP
jgi:hypothetical protein